MLHVCIWIWEVWLYLFTWALYLCLTCFCPTVRWALLLRLLPWACQAAICQTGWSSNPNPADGLVDKIQSSLQLTVSALNTWMQIFMDTMDGYGFLAQPGYIYMHIFRACKSPLWLPFTSTGEHSNYSLACDGEEAVLLPLHHQRSACRLAAVGHWRELLPSQWQETSSGAVGFKQPSAAPVKDSPVTTTA